MRYISLEPRYLLGLNNLYSTFASSAPAIATLRLIAEFGITEEVSELITVVFLLGYVLGVCFHSKSYSFNSCVLTLITL